MGPFRELRMKKTAQGGIKDERDTHHVGLRMKSDTRYMDLRMKSDTRLLAYCFWSSSVEIPRQLEATRWMDFDFRVARVSFLDFQLARVTSIWRGAQIHLARVFFRRLYYWFKSHKTTIQYVTLLCMLFESPKNCWVQIRTYSIFHRLPPTAVQIYGHLSKPAPHSGFSKTEKNQKYFFSMSPFSTSTRPSKMGI